MLVGGPGNQDVNIDLLMQRMTDVLQNQFGLKLKNQGHVYTPPFPEWYNRVALPNRVKVHADLMKFSGQDDTSTVEHIAHYLMQLGEASADEAFRIRYFPLSLTGRAFTWFTPCLLTQSAPGRIWNRSFMLIISLAVMRKS
jgi:hypothetical protein